jgi:hypothetical protein
MKSTPLRLCLITLAAGATAPVFAQSPIPIEFTRPLKNSVSVGVRMTAGGSKVKFGNLGDLPIPRLPALTPGTPQNIQYYDGFVAVDAAEAREVDDKNSTPASGSTPAYTRSWRTIRDEARGRYKTYNVTTTGTVGNPDYVETDTYVGEFLLYNAAQTRDWGYSYASQVVGDGIDMHQYGVSTQGAKTEADSDGGAGVELQFARVIQRHRKFEWGVNFSVGISDINAKTRDTIRARLDVITDHYSLRGATAPTAPYTAPVTETVIDVVDDPATEVNEARSHVEERTVPLGSEPTSRTTSSIVNGAQVDGYWQLKGAYYMIRVGPNVRVPITRRITASASAGLASAYVSTKYIAEETMVFGDERGSFGFREGDDLDAETGFVHGFYADVNVEYWLSGRTGFFAGGTYEKLGSYEQSLRGRTAKVDVGGGAGFRFGIITRF